MANRAVPRLESHYRIDHSCNSRSILNSLDELGERAPILVDGPEGHISVCWCCQSASPR